MPNPYDDDHRYDGETLPGSFIVEGLRRSGKPFVLEQIRGFGAPNRFVLKGEQVVVGRSAFTDLCIDSAEISRRHILLKKTGSEYVCEDLNSSNGVFLNGVKIHSAVLREGDTIQIGDIVFVYHEGS